MLKKRLFAVLLVLAMVIGMIPVIASAETAAPAIRKVNMTLGGVIGVNFKVDARGTDMSGYSVRVTIGADTDSQMITNYTMDGELYVYTAKLPAHRIPEKLKIELLNGSNVVETKDNWTVAAYLSDLVAINPTNGALAALANALLDYGNYAAYFAAPTGNAPSSSAVAAVKRSALEKYQSKVVTTASTWLGAVAALHLDDACDLRIKFNAETWGSHKLLINGDAVGVTPVGTQVVYEMTDMLPQNWSKLYNIKVVDADGATVYEFDYCVLSYAYICLGMSPEAQTGLNSLMRAMYLYQEAAVAYINSTDEVIENGPIDEGDGPAIEF